MVESGYAGFISYSHRDEAIAAWLHKQLEAYRIPAGVASGQGVRRLLGGRRLGKFFRDIEELPAGYPLTEKINAALARSHNLIVLCSPDAARSEFVQKEIVEFERLFHGKRIFPVVVVGDRGREEIFPPGIGGHRELLDAEIKGDDRARKQGVTKLVAGMLGVDPDDLVRRERKALRQRLFGLAAVIVLMLALLVAALLSAKTAYESRQRAFDETNMQLANSGWQALEGGRIEVAIRYALAGQRLSPANQVQYYALLEAAMARYGSRIATIPSEAAGGTGFGTLEPSNGNRITLTRIASENDEEKTFLFAPGRDPALVPIAGWPKRRSFSSDGRLFVTIKQKAPIELYLRDAVDGRILCSAKLPGDYVNSLGFSLDNRHVSAASTAGLFLVAADSCLFRKLTSAKTMETVPSVVSVGAVATVITVGEELMRVSHADGSVAPLPGGSTVGRYDEPTGNFLLFDGEAGGRTARVRNLVTGEDSELRIPQSLTTPGYYGKGDTSDLTSIHDTAISPSGAAIGFSTAGKAFFDRDHKFVRIMSEITVYDKVIASPDGGRFATVASSGIWIWPIDQPEKPLRLVESNAPGLLNESSFNADGSIFLSQAAGAIIVWDTSTGRIIGKFYDPAAGAMQLAWFAEGNRLAGLAGDGLVVWSTAQLLTVPGVAGMAYEGARVSSPSGDRLITALTPKSVAIWSYPSRRLLSRIDGDSLPWRAVFSPDGQRILVMFRDDQPYAPMPPADGKELPIPGGSSFLVDAANGAVVARIEGHSGRIADAEFSPDSKTLATVGMDGKLIVRDPLTGTVTARYDIPGERANAGEVPPSLISFSGSGRFVGAHQGMGKGAYVVVDLPARRIAAEGAWGGLSRSGERAIIWSSTPEETVDTFRVIDLATGKTLLSRSFKQDSTTEVHESPDLHYVMMGSTLKPPVMVSVDDGSEKPLPNSTYILATAYSDDGTTVAIESDSGIGVWALPSMQLLARFDTGQDRISRLSVQNGRLAFVSADGTAHLFDIATRRSLIAVNDTVGAQIHLTPTSFQVLFSRPDPANAAAFGMASGEGRPGTRFLDFSSALLSWGPLAKRACMLIGKRQQVFSELEINADPVLLANWGSSTRNVCG